jgi:hypothetical protein
MNHILHALRTTTASTWAGAVALTAIVALGSTLDDHDARRDAAADLQDAQRQAAQAARVERVAAAIEATELKAAARCRESHPGSALVWTTRGEAVCVPQPLP